MQDIYTKIFTSKKFWRVFIPVVFFVLVSGGLFLFKNTPEEVIAGWWNENWTYRKAIPVSNDTTTESNVYVSITLDTSASTTIQSDCGDFRFTSESGDILPYYVVSGCGTATTVVHVYFSIFLNGSHVIFFYYGNPSVEDGFSASDFSTVATSYTVGTVGVEEIGLGPVGYWSFDEGYGTTTYDNTSGGNDGTIAGATWQDESMCVSGKCLYFDGVNDELDMGSGSSIDGVFENGGTMNFWLKLSGWGELDPIIINKANNSTAGGWRFNIATSSRYFYFEQNHSSNIGEWRTKTNFVELNKWYFISLSYDSSSTSNKPALYVDGINQSLTTISSPLGTADSDDIDNLVIGNNSGTGTDNSYEGYLDEVKIYPYTRTADQIKQDYNAGLAGVSTSRGTSVSFGSASDSWMSDGLLGYWKMDETATTSGAIDSSGNGNDGTYYSNASTTGGKFGNGGVFDGNGDYINIINPIGLDSIPEITISFWAKFDLFETWDGVFNIDGSNLRISSTNIDPTHLVLNTSIGRVGNIIPTIDQWALYTYTYDGKNLKSYLNSDLKQAILATGNIGTSGDWNIGLRDFDTTSHNGKIDEVRIYNRALSSSEVKKLYEWAPGPVLHLKMDEKQGTTAYDTSGNGNDGTLTNGPIWARGKYGSAINLDKSDDYIEVINSTPVTLNNSLTIQLWVKLNALPTSDYTVFVEKGNYSDGYLFSTGSGSMTDLSFWYAGFSADTGEILNIGEWQNIAVTYDGANVVFYHDGINIYSIAKTGSATGNTDNITIGKSVPWGSTRNFNGSVDDLKIYNYARTQKQILEDMGGGHPAQKSPVAYYKFDEGYGATVHDETGNGNDGTASSSNSGTNTNVSQMWDLDGKYNKTMEFDGVDDYVDIGNLTETPEGTISLWFKLDNAINSGSNTNSGLFLNSNPVATPTMLARWYDSEGGGALDFWISDSGGWKNLKTKRTSWEANVWYNVLLTWDGTYMKSYINGEYDEVSVVGPPQPVASNTWRLGVSSSGVTPYYFDGRIDELKIYNYALSADETKQAYNRGVAVVVGSTGTDASGNKTNSDLREYCVPGDTSPCTPPTLEFKLDEKQGTTAYDTSGNGNDGTLGGDGIGTDLPTWTQGQNGSGLEFDGTDDYLSFQDIPFGGTNPITVCGWGRSDSIVSNHVLVHQGTEIVLRLNNNNIEWILNSFTTNDRLAIPIGISIEEWTYFCGVYESGGDLIVYLNGKEEGRVTPTGTYANSGAQFELGRLNTAQEAWDGAIDDVKIYDYARTGAQIAWDYNKGKPIAHWDFDECSGSTAHDQNANANPGTITIGPSGTQTSLGNCSTASTSTAWYNGRDGKINESLNFDGTDDYISVGDTGLDINTISFWIKQGYSDNFFIDLNGGTSTITLANSVITTTGFSLPTIYIDGIEKSTILDNVWHQVTVMADTSIYVNNLNIGKINTGYYTGLFDEIKLYNYPLTEEQVKIKYNNGAVKFGG